MKIVFYLISLLGVLYFLLCAIALFQDSGLAPRRHIFSLGFELTQTFEELTNLSGNKEAFYRYVKDHFTDAASLKTNDTDACDNLFGASCLPLFMDGDIKGMALVSKIYESYGENKSIIYMCYEPDSKGVPFFFLFALHDNHIYFPNKVKLIN